MSLLPHSMVKRVALTCAVGFVVSGVVVALVTGLLADRQMLRQEDRHLRDAARTFAQELDENPASPTSITQHERHELEHTGMVLALFAAGTLIAGDPSLSEVPIGQCVDVGTRRACAVAQGDRTAVVARDQQVRREQREATASSASVAVVVTGIFSTLLALTMARALTRPLVRLSEAVTNVDEPATADLGPSTQVSEVEALRGSLQATFSRLGEALGQSRRFASNAAHQLRTPVTAILGELELAQEQLGSHSPEELARAHRGAARLSTLIDRLLILAQIDDKLSVATGLDLLEVIEDAVDTLPLVLRARIKIEADSTRVQGDRSLLTAALANALENALKFSDGDVRTGTQLRGATAVLWVEDLGPGITSAERELVFAPFYRARGTHAVPGHGIGLAVIAHVLVRHGGHARFVDCTRGARLELSLPALG